MDRWQVIGIMSGTSLDGLDIALCEFWFDTQWHWKIQKAEVIPYAGYWKNRIEKVFNESAYELTQLDAEYGSYIGTQVNLFCEKNQIDKSLVEAVSSHGHTIFHQPKLGFTFQLGNGAQIAAKTNLKTICDFRSLDVARGGQGAPLVPIGDMLLFPSFDACLNLGGFANISLTDRTKRRVAFDICPVNFVLNHYANKLGHAYDAGGENAKKGKCNTSILKVLNNLSFYSNNFPKSLGREWTDEHIFGHLDEIENMEDILHTFTEHIVYQINNIIQFHQIKSLLVTGGGAYNTYLMDRLKEQTKIDIIIPEDEVIQYKEALIFAFLGLLRIQRKINTLASATGGKQDSISGAIYIP